MAIMLVLAAVLVGFAVVMITRGVAISRSRSAPAVTAIEGYGFTPGALGVEDAREGLLERLADRLGRIAGSRLGSIDNLRKRLIAAGLYETAPVQFVGYQVLAAITLPLGWLLLSGLVGASGLAAVIGFVWAAALGILGPLYYLSRQGRVRQAAIERELPELIDLLVVTVEAGVGFAGALRVAAGRLVGPLAEELRLTLQEQNMGLTTSEALRNLGDRCPTTGIKIFVRSIMQGETLGVSMGQIMRNVALEMRKRRRALAEERAQKAPVKMLFPLIFLIFPAMFIVLLVPAIIAFFRALSG